MAAHRAVFPSLTIREALTLGRLVLLDSVPGNGESWFLARCFELLRTTGIIAVESCADPEPRTTTSGAIVLRGHVGTIYQATNGHYVGKTNPCTLRLLPDGTCYSNRTSGKRTRRRRAPLRGGATGALGRGSAARRRGRSDVDAAMARSADTADAPPRQPSIPVVP
jgi:hypothetical protein